jgi:DNA repair exonuclease SbcCD nuclease subunit
MIKLALCSDLHLEFEDIVLKNEGNAEVLILSGDIMIAADLHDHPEPMVPYSPEIVKILGSRQRKANEYRNFLKRCSFQFPHVVYVAGNHEFYHGKWNESLQDLRNECSKFNNVYFLENDSKTIGEYTFIGGTLWTDLNKGDPLTMHSITGILSDYSFIRNDALGYTKLRAAHTISRHRSTVKYIESKLAELKDSKVIVVGHHAPSHLSIHPMYRDETIMNGGYYSDLSELILNNPHIKLWTHGHMHNPFDYNIGDTRIVCNPRGYSGHDAAADYFELKYFDIQ